jgi:hypothetical protein
VNKPCNTFSTCFEDQCQQYQIRLQITADTHSPKQPSDRLLASRAFLFCFPKPRSLEPFHLREHPFRDRQNGQGERRESRQHNHSESEMATNGEQGRTPTRNAFGYLDRHEFQRHNMELVVREQQSKVCLRKERDGAAKNACKFRGSAHRRHHQHVQRCFCGS